jgi:PAS domain S-box-containing protein
MMTVTRTDLTGSMVHRGLESPEGDHAATRAWAPQQAAQALANAFAEALAVKPDLTEAVTEALRSCIESGVLSAGCLYEVQETGDVVPRAHAGFAGAEKRLRDLFGQSWLLADALDSATIVRIPSARVPLPAAVELMRGAGATAVIVAPLIALGARIGVLVLAARDVDVLDEAVVASARVVAAQLARAAADARLLQQTRHSEQRHRAAFDHSQDAILLFDDESRIIAANGQAERLFDQCEAELMGRQLADFTLPEDRLVANALRNQLRAQGYLAVHRMRLRRRDGRIIDVDATASRGRCNGGYLQVIVLRDMTHRRHAREGLSVSEERYRALVEATGDTWFTIDRALRLTGVFGRCPAEAGLDAAGGVGKSLGDALAEAAPAHLAAARRALAGEVATFEWVATSGDQTRCLQTSISPVVGTDGDVRSLVGVTREVTERRTRQARQLAADHMSALGLLAGSIANDLSTSVAAVLTNLSHVNLLVGEVQTHAAGEGHVVDLASLLHAVEPLRDARDAAEKLREVVQGLRMLTREERLGTVDIAQVLDMALRIAAPVVKRRARVVRNYQGPLPTLGNESLLVQVFLSLIVNAAQACPERGSAKYEVRLTHWRDDHGRIVVEVADTGAGIAPEDLDRIFEPFFTTKPVGVGTGLGLSVARSIVKALGGEIHVETELGKGTAVRVVLSPAEAQIDEPARA